MVSKQLLLGIGLVVGGGALVGILNSGDKTPKQSAVDDVAHPKVELRQDIHTEKHLSEQKKKERENNTLAQEQQAKEFVEEQERAKQQLSLASRTDTSSAVATTPVTNTNTTNTINASVNSVVSEVSAMLPNTSSQQSTMVADELTVQVRPEAIVATQKAEENKRKQQARAKQQKANANRKDAHVIVHGDSLSKLSRQYNVPISAILSANNMSDADLLIAGDKIIIPNKSTAKKATKANDTVAKAEKKSNKSETTAQAKKSNNAKNVKPFYSVQVSLADNEAKANELAKKYRQAGYKVQTSKTSRGVRVLVGSTSSAEEANKLKAKLSKDSRVNADDAWVKRVDTINP